LFKEHINENNFSGSNRLGTQFNAVPKRRMTNRKQCPVIPTDITLQKWRKAEDLILRPKQRMNAGAIPISV